MTEKPRATIDIGAISRQIIEAHNGRILLESDPNSLPGSTFTICLPV